MAVIGKSPILYWTRQTTYGEPVWAARRRQRNWKGVNRKTFYVPWLCVTELQEKFFDDLPAGPGRKIQLVAHDRPAKDRIEVWIKEDIDCCLFLDGVCYDVFEDFFDWLDSITIARKTVYVEVWYDG